MKMINQRKMLSTLRIVLIVIIIPITLYLVGNVSKSYDNLVKQNEILLDQKKIYEEIINLNSNQAEEKAELLKTLSVANEMIKYYNTPIKIRQNGWIWITIIFIVSFNFIFRFIDKKIEKTKSIIS